MGRKLIQEFEVLETLLIEYKTISTAGAGECHHKGERLQIIPEMEEGEKALRIQSSYPLTRTAVASFLKAVLSGFTV